MKSVVLGDTELYPADGGNSNPQIEGSWVSQRSEKSKNMPNHYDWNGRTFVAGTESQEDARSLASETLASYEPAVDDVLFCLFGRHAEIPLSESEEDFYYGIGMDPTLSDRNNRLNMSGRETSRVLDTIIKSENKKPVATMSQVLPVQDIEYFAVAIHPKEAPPDTITKEQNKETESTIVTIKANESSKQDCLEESRQPSETFDVEVEDNASMVDTVNETCSESSLTSKLGIQDQEMTITSSVSEAPSKRSEWEDPPVIVVGRDGFKGVLMRLVASLGKPVHVKPITPPKIHRRSIAESLASTKAAIMITTEDKAVARAMKSLVKPVNAKPIAFQNIRKKSKKVNTVHSAGSTCSSSESSGTLLTVVGMENSTTVGDMEGSEDEPSINVALEQSLSSEGIEVNPTMHPSLEKDDLPMKSVKRSLHLRSPSRIRSILTRKRSNQDAAVNA